MKKYIFFFSIFIYSFDIYSSNKCGFSIDFMTGKDTAIKHLHPEVKYNLDSMIKKAKENGLEIEVVSGFRTFERQKKIWNFKYNKYIKEGLSPINSINKIIRYSTIPGTSRHHWGTDIDIVIKKSNYSGDLLLEKHFKKNGMFFELKKWLDKNANNFGFYLVYTENKNRKGFNYEPWHFSYKKVAKKIFRCYIKKVDLKDIVNNINGYSYIDNKFLEKYLLENIMGINPELK